MEDGEARQMRALVSYELKLIVAYHFSNVKDSNLAHAGYCYALLGTPQDLPAITMGLADMGITHYFKIKWPTTRSHSVLCHVQPVLNDMKFLLTTILDNKQGKCSFHQS